MSLLRRPAPRCETRLRLAAVACAAVLTSFISAASVGAADGLTYRTVFEGAPAGLTKRLLTDVSRLAALEKQGAQSLVALDRRAELDTRRIRELAHSEGYYDALIERRIDETAEPLIVTIVIDAGERYTISRCEVLGDETEEDAGVFAAARERAAKLVGQPARAKLVVDAEAELVEDVEAKGYPLVEVTSRRYVVDHAARVLAVELNLAAGRKARFGQVDIVGATDVSPTYVRNRLPWKDGSVYDPAAVEKGRRELATTGLFSHVSVHHADATDADGNIPMTVTLAESKFRSVGARISYDSSLGAGGGLSWEHRNVRGAGEKLRLSGDVAQSGWSAALVWREPDFLRPGYTFEYRAGYEEKDTNAYEVHRAATGVGLEVPLTLAVTANAGTTFEWTPVQTKAREENSNERDQDETFWLLGFPLGLRRTTTDDLLQPTHGTRTELSATPFFEVSGKSLAFVVTRVTPSVYVPLHVPRLGTSVLAGRLSLGSIQGAKRDDTPADKRFYAGGGGSIRGYDYQRVGPLDDDNEPLGGRSLLELGTELRVRLGESFGIVGFVEGGNVYTSLYPDLDDVIRWGAGGGFRYYSGVGPLRIDVATPINGRGSDVDDPIQVYISLGEAF